eukprot:6062716-Prymnesium_polylepis.2
MAQVDLSQPPPGWGRQPTSAPDKPSGMHALETLAEKLALVGEACPTGDVGQRRDAVRFLCNLYTNNAAVADLWLVDGSIDNMKYGCTQEWGVGLRVVRTTLDLKP